ncbi:trichohyalin-like [Ictalurus punctatus]|uniref:Trichohyalin-like n=1 Tax=Ictalurus punctatus TaxID=7998 RepID=A0A9F7TPU3_ICTPU|nr:trichohyalin-like [Ictalurus punctatus]XP_053540769.1 trichohyalin-like [Ictalurus punctatus]
MEALEKERDEMKGTFQVDKDSLVLQLEEERRNMEKEKERFELQLRDSDAREAQMREEMEALEKEMDEMRRTFQADKDSLVLQLEEERRNMEKEKERWDKMESRQQIVKGGWKKHCDVLVQMIVEKEEMLEEITVEVEALKGTVRELKQKARDMDPEMMEELKEVDKRLRNFGPKWFQKLRKKKNMKKRQYLEKEIERLELQLRDSKAREARSTEVINIMMKERLKMKRQLAIHGLLTDIFQRRSKRENDEQQERLDLELRESMAREDSTTDMINALVKERVEMMKRFQEEKESMALKLKTERENMEKEKNQERFKLLKREREAMEEFMVEKMNELRTQFQAEKERMEKKILEKDKMLEITEEMEDSAEMKKKAGMKEGLNKVDKKLKHSPLQCFQKLWKKKNIKGRQQMEKEQKRLELQWRESETREVQMREEALVEERFQPQKEKMVLEFEKERENMEKDLHQVLVTVVI